MINFIDYDYIAFLKFPFCRNSRNVGIAKMSVGPLAVEIACVCCLAAFLLHRYGNWRKQHVLVTLATFISWYFSFMIIFVLPLDVSSVSLEINNYIQ